MELWVKILAGSIAGAAVLVSVVFLVWRHRSHRMQQQRFISGAEFSGPKTPTRSEDAFQAAMAKLRLSHKSSLRFHHLHRQQAHHENHQHHERGQAQAPPPFSWESHPRLISEAAENGWSRFVFANRTLIPRSSPLWGLCAVCDGERLQSVGEISWEVPPGSSNYMQTVRLNPNTKGSVSVVGAAVADEVASCSSIRMSLPLPGPQLIGTSFPQEAYFEITILYLQPMNRAFRSGKKSRDGEAGDGQDDQVKLMEESPDGGVQSVVSDVVDGKKIKKSPLQGAKCLISLGLTVGGSPLAKSTPGTSPGSIAFQSNGSVHLDGLKLVSESEKTDWAAVNRVIGCGFDPSKKKVFFTVDTELVHVIRCNSDAYKSPLYPVLVANSDVMVLVNLGQAVFKYAPANAQRTPNPCFIRSPIRNEGLVLGCEDSKELFSMGKVDSQWRGDEKKSKSSGGNGSRRDSRQSSSNWEDGSMVADIDGDSDLFEISLNT